MEIKEKLEANNNFHLCFKTILITDNEMSLRIAKQIGKSYVLDNNKDYFEQLLMCKNNNIEYILYDGLFPYFIPLFVVITNGNENLVKPFVKVFYICKDNRIENRIIDKCRENESPFYRVKSNEIEDKIINEVRDYYEM